tara:strand:- start:774 stop:1109 length:336 start_codon:yes stop_codon:yes gene_type:complete
MIEDSKKSGMSTRPREDAAVVHPLRAELEETRESLAEQKHTTLLSTEVVYSTELDSLTHKERQVVSLGVSPDEWRPISMLNTAHYNTLLKANAISGSLAAKLESYKSVAEE